MSKKSVLVVSALIVLTFCSCNSDSSISNVQNNKNEKSYTTTEQTQLTGTIKVAKSFSDGLAWVLYTNDITGQEQCACINTEGKIQFTLDGKVDYGSVQDGDSTSDDVGNFCDGYAVVKDRDNNNYIIDSKGDICASSKDGNFDSVICYDDGFFLVKNKRNDFHEVKFNYSVIDSNGNTICENCFSSDQEITDQSVFEYRKENVFSYKTKSAHLSDGRNSDNYDCINAKTKKKFSLESVNRFYHFNEGQAVITREYGDEKYQLLDSNGNAKNIRIKNGTVESGLLDGAVIYSETNDDGLKLYDTKTNTSSDLYSVGNGIIPSQIGYSNGNYLIDISDTTDFSGNKYKHYFSLVDKKGNDLFKPVEGEVWGFSCDRIVTKEKVFDSKGNEICSLDNFSNHGRQFNDNYLTVDSLNNYSYMDNYINIEGNMLFKDTKIIL